MIHQVVIPFGGIIGSNSDYFSTETRVEYCCNLRNVSGTNNRIGGICGDNYNSKNRGYITNCYIGSDVSVTLISGSSTYSPSANIGTSSRMLGWIVGKTTNSSSTYINNVGWLKDTEYTVYNVVNGLSSEESEYWSNTNVNEPTLKWEANIK